METRAAKTVKMAKKVCRPSSHVRSLNPIGPDFIDNQAELDDGYTVPSSRRLRDMMRDMGGEDPDDIVRRLEARFRRMPPPQTSCTDDQLSRDLTRWVHTADACPTTAAAPIWRLRVTVSIWYFFFLYAD
jgi:hypothetical protein